MARKLAAVVFSLGCMQASSVMALGLGELKLESFLNQPLKASVDLLNTGGLHQEEIKIRLATREDFDKLGLDRAYFLTNITFEVVVDENGGASIILASDESVLEPYLDFIVEARWPSGRLLREYTVLIDPPVFKESSELVSASQRVEEVEGIPAPSKKNESTVATSGTKVAVKKSDLAPGAMPQRNFNASTSASPLSGSRYMINRNDTLWEIASNGKPEGVSVHQTMLDIQRLNPDAFLNGNINQIKAGYIVYLPTAEDISSADLGSALAEVKEQNSAWREGRASEGYAGSGPSLRISAEPQEATTNSEGGSSAGAEEGAGGVEAMDAAELANMDAQERMAAMQQQVETLQRIVNLKDEQIAALQNAVGDATANSDALDAAATQLEDAEAELEASMVAEEVAAEAAAESVAQQNEEQGFETGSDTSSEAANDESEAAVSSEPISVTPPETVTEEAESGGWLSYLLYALGAAVLGVFAFLFIRSRRQDDDELEEPSPRVAKVADVFSDVTLKDPPLAVEPRLELEPAADVDPLAQDPEKRGYGERKHDEYASDVEASDALAEADIYIAYGRHPQAIDLLNNAIANEPNNPVYRLKLIEIYAEQQDRGGATAQLEQLQALGDASSTAEGESLIAAMDAPAEAAPAEPADTSFQSTPDNSPGLEPNPLEMMSASDAPLESEFTALEIEDGAADDDELDLSADFDSGPVIEDNEEELVIAADANGLSTKLDLARAYLDMGDEDGAREILEEVVAEGSDDLKAEAQSLMDRIGE